VAEAKEKRFFPKVGMEVESQLIVYFLLDPLVALYNSTFSFCKVPLHS
jgi:hypothetical protein